MAITSPLKKSIRAVLHRVKTAEIFFNDRISGKRKSVFADQLVFNRNSFLAYAKSIDYFLPFNRIEEIKTDNSAVWSKRVFEEENKLKIINRMIDELKKKKMFSVWFDFFRKNKRVLGSIHIGSVEDKFWVTVEECDEKDIHADDLFIRDERHIFKTAEEAVNFALSQNSDVTPFDFIEGVNGFMADVAKSFRVKNQNV